MSSAEPDNPMPDPQPMAEAVPDNRARPPRNDRLFLRALPFFAHHGVYEEERRLGQRFIVDADWWLDARPAAWADKAELTVSYQDVYEHIKAVVEDDPVNLIETLAERIASRLLDHFPLIDQVRIAVHKPGAPITGVFGDVGVEITRQR
ncbi:dihydroneopterin aldolase [Azorhizobium oxalatiphilum]|uniref:7,8-dihydroneopterin aldolase n=1 Tax=Azorhizobium oxalatiphilum TaxID=980631 RepID=A0A917BWY4_9HYPH|nr:dihydroneopterin aldolase [Azorhizobium oxalatiphilum]GGF62198.1 dihydroneopterin aldolase [Azorhizobium oxalatiphilum]